MSKYLVKFQGQSDYHSEIPYENLLAMTEGAKIWRKGTVKDLLDRGFEVGTPRAWFKKGIVKP